MRRYKGYFKKSSSKHRVFDKVFIGVAYDEQIFVEKDGISAILKCDGISQHGVKCSCGWANPNIFYDEVEKCENCGGKLFNSGDIEVLEMINKTNHRQYFQELKCDSSMKFRVKEKG